MKCIDMSIDDYNKLSNSPESWYCITCLSDALPYYNAGINDFNEITKHVPIKDKFCNWKFKPFLLNDTLFDVNDVNLSKIDLCKYHTVEELHTVVNDNDLSSNVSCFHLNCRGFSAKQNDVQSLIQSLKFDCSFITLSETWLTESNAALFSNTFPNYSFFHNSRINSRGGGIAAFINNKFHVTSVDVKSYTSFEIYNSVLLG